MNLDGISKLSLEEARALAKSQLQMKKSSTKYNNLLRDLDRAPSSREVERIMWNVELVGQGLSMPDSAWQKLHRNAS